MDLPPEEFDSLITKYDIKENGRFCYSDFLRHFMITMRPKDGGALTARRKLQPLKVPVSNSLLFVAFSFYSLLLHSAVAGAGLGVRGRDGEGELQKRLEYC